MTITIDENPGQIRSCCFEFDDDMTMAQFAAACRVMAYTVGYDIADIDEHIPEESYYPRELDNEL